MGSVGGNKHSKPGKNINERDNSGDIIKFGKVVSNDDEFDGNRIKARIKGADDHLSDADLPFCFPLIPKHINVMPKVGETVIIFTFNLKNNYENRLWSGPIISQPQKLKKDPHFFSSTSLFDNNIVSPEQAPSTQPDASGVFPNKEDIAFQGRDNSDVILKANEVLIRAGKSELANILKFNKKDPGYIQIKKTKDFSVTNIISSKIHLISHEGNPKFVLNDQKELITNEELKKIIENTHPMVYGDILNEFLKLVKLFIANHVHPYPGLPPVQTTDVIKTLNFNLDSLLSKNIRIN